MKSEAEVYDKIREIEHEIKQHDSKEEDDRLTTVKETLEWVMKGE